MRFVVVFGVLVLMALGNVACNTCYKTHLVQDRRVTGTVGWQVGDATSAAMQESFSEYDAVMFGDQGATGPTGSRPFELRIKALFPLQGANGKAYTSEPVPRIAFELTVRDVTAESLDIDLDDGRASLSAGQNDYPVFSAGWDHHFGQLTGHLHIAKLPQVCIDHSTCPDASGTFAFSATGPNGERIQLEGGTFTAHDTIDEVPGMCEPLA